jgi:hypothetical protein
VEPISRHISGPLRGGRCSGTTPPRPHGGMMMEEIGSTVPTTFSLVEPCGAVILLAQPRRARGVNVVPRFHSTDEKELRYLEDLVAVGFAPAL